MSLKEQAAIALKKVRRQLDAKSAELRDLESKHSKCKQEAEALSQLAENLKAVAASNADLGDETSVGDDAIAAMKSDKLGGMITGTTRNARVDATFKDDTDSVNQSGEPKKSAKKTSKDSPF